MSEPQRQRTHQWHPPMAGLEAARECTGLEYLQGMMEGRFPPPPIAMTLGFTLAEVAHGRAVFECVPQEFHYNPIGTVHGGLACTLLDSAMACSVHSTLPAGGAYTTLELKVNLVRPISHETGLLRAEGRLIHGGRRSATAEGRILDAAGKLYAHGTTTCMILGS
jgi:uncharacterized protein (TIGR00369 family)